MRPLVGWLRTRPPVRQSANPHSRPQRSTLCRHPEASQPVACACGMHSNPLGRTAFPCHMLSRPQKFMRLWSATLLGARDWGVGGTATATNDLMLHMIFCRRGGRGRFELALLRPRESIVSAREVLMTPSGDDAWLLPSGASSVRKPGNP